MVEKSYKRQVELLLNVLPEVTKISCFALHGGTAINLFIQNMPRLSVDIDLTYLPIEDRVTSLRNISLSLLELKKKIETINPTARIAHKEAISKLIVSSQGVQIKVEVNQVSRGTIKEPTKLVLCDKAQNEFDVFCAVSVVPKGQLYGGKICAALDRQHPRDLFDIKRLLETGEITPEIKEGFLLCLLGSDRPIHEVLAPNLLDQRQTMTNHFDGMSEEPFTYDDFENTRSELITKIQKCLTATDKKFLIGFKNLLPDWNVYNFEHFPAVQWKLKNLQTLRDKNPAKHEQQLKLLCEILPVSVED